MSRVWCSAIADNEEDAEALFNEFEIMAVAAEAEREVLR